MAADKAEEKTIENAEVPADGQAADGKKKFGMKKILLIVVPVVLLLGGGGAAYFMGLLGGHGDKLQCENVTEEDEHYAACAEELAKAASGTAPGVFIDIPNMIVNLSSTSKQPRFLKISLKIELKKPEDQKDFETALPRVIDQFQTYLRELRVEDLRGSSGMYRMKIELLSRVRAAAPTIEVSDVLFQEILIQ